MIKYKKYFLLLIFCFIFLNFNCDTFGFKKKEKPVIKKMVETQQEYLQQSINVPLKNRTLPDFKPIKEDEKYIYPAPKYVFEKYNYPPGKREVNISSINKNLDEKTYFVVDSSFKYAAYVKYYLNPDINQISSNFYVEKLDTSKSKKDRVLNFHEEQLTRKPILESGTRELYHNLYKGLSIVDWNKNSTKILVKEKVGSLVGGVYKTYLYIYFMPQEVTSGKLIKLDNFDEAIKDYFLSWNKLQLTKYSYDIVPAGFSENNDNVIIVYCQAYDIHNNKIFLGTWGYDYIKNQVILFSKTQQNQNISSNGLILRQIVD